MSQSARQRFSFYDYVVLEEISAVKHEFLDGQAWAMAGGSPEHAALAVNVSALLSAAVRGKPCRVFSSDLRIRVKATGLGTYPDVSVVCGQLDLDPEDPKQQTVTNPLLLVEVLSPSNEAYDRGEKLEHYKRIESVRDIVLVAHDERRVDVWHRDGEVWTAEVVRERGAARIESLDCELPLDEVFRDPLAR